MKVGRFREGLVVGKFCPLHRGHELVIGRALQDCEHVSIVSYTQPELAGCEPDARERWLRRRFPQASVLVIDQERITRMAGSAGLRQCPMLPANAAAGVEHHDFIGWLCVEILARPVDAVFTSEGYGDAFAADLSRYLSRSLGVVHRVRHVPVDRERSMVAVSGTGIREDPERFRAYAAPDVYADFVRGVREGPASGHQERP